MSYDPMDPSYDGPPPHVRMIEDLMEKHKLWDEGKDTPGAKPKPPAE